MTQSSKNNTKKSANNLPDICSKKHKGHKNSKKAFSKVCRSISKTHLDIIKFLKSCKNGATTFDIYDHFEKTPNALSGRISELKQRKKIEVVGRKANKYGNTCDVVVVKEGK